VLLIGSHAAILNGLPLTRKPIDIDLIMSPSDFVQLKEFLNDDIERTILIDKRRVALKLKSSEIVEIEIAWPDSSAEWLLRGDLMCPEIPFFRIAEIQVGPHTLSVDVPLLNVLLALKLSHRYKKNSPHFLKTMHDIHALRKTGADVDGLQDFIKLREKETYDYAHPSLKRDKKNFFKDDGIKYVYDHDSIHEAVALGDKPAYRSFSAEGQEVYSSKELFNKCSEQLKLSAVVEESYVLALERSQIPFKGQVDPDRSFTMALQKVCTSITSGWFREYAWEHYWEAMSMYSPDYVNVFWNAVEKNKVKPHKVT